MKNIEMNKTEGVAETANKKAHSNWEEIERSIKYLRKTDNSGLSWRELLGRPHECNNR